MTRPTWNEYFINMAIAASTRSTCPRASVGAVIVCQDKYPIATGYNGSIAGEPHCIDEGCIIVDGHCIRTLHAESNAINIAKRVSGLDVTGMTMYCTHAPCWFCAQYIVGSGISKVFYLNAYMPTNGLDYLLKYIQVEKVKL